MKNDLQTIIAAGGLGKRLGINAPKSSLIYKRKSLVQWTVSAMEVLGVKSIDVYVDTPKWEKKYVNQLKNIKTCRVFNDSGYNNTFLLFKEYSRKGTICLFTYGHAPCSPQYYKKLLRQNSPISASIVKHSTKREVIPTCKGMFIEPPFLIRIDDVCLTGIYSWYDFFQTNMERVNYISGLNVGEFNYKKDWEDYQNHLPKVIEKVIEYESHIT